MKYIKPTYKSEIIMSNDIILASSLLEGGATLKEINSTSAQVDVSALDVLGFR